MNLPQPDVSIDNELFVARTYNNSIYTTSLEIAEKFNKQHKNILRDIRTLISSSPQSKSMFDECFYINKNNRNMPMYKVNKNGFMLLTMNFTGTQYIDLKIKYIYLFDKLDNLIRGLYHSIEAQMSSFPKRGSIEFIAMALEDCEKLRKEAVKKLEDVKPAINFYNSIVNVDDGILVRDYAKLVTQHLRNNGFNDVIGQKRLYAWLVDNEYLLKPKRDYVPSQKSISMNLFKITQVIISVDNSNEKLRKTVKITGKGQVYFMEKIMNLYNNNFDIENNPLTKVIANDNQQNQ